MSWNNPVTDSRAIEIDMEPSPVAQPPCTKAAGVKWFKEWVPQDTVLNNGKCKVLKWVNEETLKALREKQQEKEPDPEPVAPRFYLCSYDGCGKIFTDSGALRKHSHVHGEKQYVCHYEGCGKKFLDSSKLKRHFLTHTGEKHFVCTHEGCGKAFSLDFNLRAHMRTHLQENYYICHFEDCGKRYAHEYKLKAHIKATHEKNLANAFNKLPQSDKDLVHHHKCSTKGHGSGPPDRPYVCPFDGCDKSYIHEYKLNLHLKREHAGETPEENCKRESQSENEMDHESDHDINLRNTTVMAAPGRGKLRLTSSSASNIHSKFTNVTSVDLLSQKSSRMVTAKEPIKEQDSEETEDQEDTDNDGWDNGSETNEDDDEETEDDMD